MIIRHALPSHRTRLFLLSGLIFLWPTSAMAAGGAVTERLTDFQSPQGRVVNAQRAAVGDRVVYLASQDLASVFELYSAASAGGGVTKLNQPLVSGGDVLDFVITPDGGHVVFRADAEIDEKIELYRVPIGGGTVEKMNGPMVPAGDVEQYAVSPDSGHVLYTATQNSFLIRDLYGHTLSSGVVAKLSSGLANNEGVTDFTISPDSLQVAWVEGDLLFSNADGFLRASPIGGGGPFVLETNPVEQFVFTADSADVIYRRGQTSDLRRVPVGGGAGVDLAPGYAVQGSFVATADRSKVFFIGDFDGGNHVLYALDPVGATVSAVSVGGGVISSLLQLSAGDATLLFCQGPPHTLHAVAVAAGTPVELTGSCPEDELAISADGLKVAYREFQNGSERLFGRPTDGSSPATELAPEVQISQTGRFDFIFFDATADRVIYLSEHENGGRQVYSVPWAGGASTRLNGEPLSGDSVTVHQIDTSVFYSADQDTLGLRELYSAPAAGGASSKWNDSMLGTGGVVSNFALSPDESYVVFTANLRDGKPQELWSYHLATGTGPTLLSGPILSGFDGVESFAISPTGTVVVYRSSFGTGVDRIYSVLIWGEPLSLLSDPVDEPALEGFGITGGGGWVYYFVGNGSSDSLRRVWIEGGVVETLVPAADRYVFSPGKRLLVYQDGANPWQSLNLVDGSTFEILPANAERAVYSQAGTRIVYWVDQGFGELYSIPFNGGVATRLHDASSPCNGSADDYVVSPDSSRVVFWCGGSIYSVPIDGGPVATLTPFTLQDMVVSADGSTVIGRRANGGTVDLVSVPILGGAHATLFSIPVDLADPEIPEYAITPDSTHAVALTRKDVLQDNYDLMSAPLGGGTPVHHNGENTRAASFRLSPDGSRVFFVEAPLRNDASMTTPRSELVSGPVEGGELLRFHPQMPFGGRVSRYIPGSRYVLYTANLEQENAVDLFLAIEASIFADGFESGDLTAWGSALP